MPSAVNISNAGVTLYKNGKVREGIAMMQRAEKLARTSGDANIIRITSNLAGALNESKNFTEALKVLYRLVALAEPLQSAYTLNIIADVHVQIGDRDSALAALDNEITILRMYQDRALYNALHNKGALLRELGRHAESKAAFAEKDAFADAWDAAHKV